MLRIYCKEKVEKKSNELYKILFFVVFPFILTISWDRNMEIKKFNILKIIIDRAINN